MNRKEKEGFVAQFKEEFLASEFIALTNNKGLTVAESTDLRDKLRSIGTRYKVSKNTLLRLIVEGSDKQSLLSYLTGPTAVAYGSDPVNIAKALIDFAKEHNKLGIGVGYFNGQILSQNELVHLSKLPSLPDLLATLLMYLRSGVSRTVQYVQSPMVEIHRALEFIATQ